MSRELDAEVAEKVMGLRVLGRANCLLSQDGCGWYVVGDNKPCQGSTLEPVYAEPTYNGEACEGEALIDGVPACWCKGVPDYTTEVVADYEVLKRVRTSWPLDQQREFFLQLEQVVRSRTLTQTMLPLLLMFVEPGDYSKAAIAALAAQTPAAGREGG